jgi:hypothetical protein
MSKPKEELGSLQGWQRIADLANLGSAAPAKIRHASQAQRAVRLRLPRRTEPQVSN